MQQEGLTTEQKQRIQNFIGFVEKLPLSDVQKLQFVNNYIDNKKETDSKFKNSFNECMNEIHMLKMEYDETMKK